jgi:hypothetical protein
MLGEKKSGRIKKICIFHHVCLVGMIEKIYIFLCLVEEKNEMMKKVICLNLLNCSEKTCK